jgi:hypothetical protein
MDRAINRAKKDASVVFAQLLTLACMAGNDRSGMLRKFGKLLRLRIPAFSKSEAIIARMNNQPQLINNKFS